MSAFDRVQGRTEPRDVRAAGAVVAAAIALVIAVVGLALVPGIGWVLGIAGLPGTTWLAWRLAPRAARGGTADAAHVALELGILAIVVADVLVVAVLLAAASAAGSADRAFTVGAVLGAIAQAGLSFLALVVIGASMFGLPAAVVVLPAAFAWVFVVRFLSSRERG